MPFPRVVFFFFLTSVFQREISTQCGVIILKLLPLYATVIKVKEKKKRRKKKVELVGRKVKFKFLKMGEGNAVLMALEDGISKFGGFGTETVLH